VSKTRKRLGEIPLRSELGRGAFASGHLTAAPSVTRAIRQRKLAEARHRRGRDEARSCHAVCEREELEEETRGLASDQDSFATRHEVARVHADSCASADLLDGGDFGCG